MNHDIEKNDTGYQCKVCTKAWKTKPHPRSQCPGVTWYPNGTAPEHLKTVAQLRKMDLKPGAPRRAVVDGRTRRVKSVWDLFDVAEAIWLSQEEIAAIKEKARQARHRFCGHCQTEVRKETYNREYEACHKCLPAVLEREERVARKRAEARECELREMLAQDRKESISWAKRLLDRSDWVILDTETTGLDYGAEIISITVVSPTGETLIDSLVKPNGSIPPDATAVNGITDDMVSNAPLFSNIFPQLCQALDGKLVIAYNAEFDQTMLIATCARYKLPYGQLISYGRLKDGNDNSSSPWQCAMMQYAAYVGEWSNYWASYRWQKLPKGDHTAKGDCMAVLELIRHMAAAPITQEAQA